MDATGPIRSDVMLKNREVASLRLQKIVVVGIAGMPERMVIADLKERNRYEVR